MRSSPAHPASILSVLPGNRGRNSREETEARAERSPKLCLPFPALLAAGTARPEHRGHRGAALSLPGARLAPLCCDRGLRAVPGTASSVTPRGALGRWWLSPAHAPESPLLGAPLWWRTAEGDVTVTVPAKPLMSPPVTAPLVTALLTRAMTRERMFR